MSAASPTLTCAVSSDFGAQITPFASRTFQYTKEQLGQADDKVVRLVLPPQFIMISHLRLDTCSPMLSG